MTTDEEKSKISKLLKTVEVPEVRLSERCSDLVKEIHKKFDQEVEEEERQNEQEIEVHENPYRPDQKLLEENELKLKTLLAKSKRVKKESTPPETGPTPDPKRPWRTNTNKERLHRIDSEIKQHLERSSQSIVPLAESEMKILVQECATETKTAPAVGMERLRETVEAAKKNLPNFQYRKIPNTTATAILSTAHEVPKAQENKKLTVESEV